MVKAYHVPSSVLSTLLVLIYLDFTTTHKCRYNSFNNEKQSCTSFLPAPTTMSLPSSWPITLVLDNKKQRLPIGNLEQRWFIGLAGKEVCITEEQAVLTD